MWLAIAASMALHSPQGDEMVLVCVPIPGKVLVKSAEHFNVEFRL